MPMSRQEWEKRHQVKYTAKDMSKRIDELREQMIKLAKELKFEEAASIRDEIQTLEQDLLLMPN